MASQTVRVGRNGRHTWPSTRREVDCICGGLTFAEPGIPVCFPSCVRYDIAFPWHMADRWWGDMSSTAAHEILDCTPRLGRR